MDSFLTDNDVIVLLRMLRYKAVLGVDHDNVVKKLQERLGKGWERTLSVAYAKRNGLPE